MLLFGLNFFVSIKKKLKSKYNKIDDDFDDSLRMLLFCLEIFLLLQNVNRIKMIDRIQQFKFVDTVIPRAQTGFPQSGAVLKNALRE